MKTRLLILTWLLLAGCVSAMAQNKVSIKLKDAENGEPVAFATVTLRQNGAKNPKYAALSNSGGEAVVTGVKSGSYTLKAELMGYKEFVRDIKVDKSLNLGEIEMKQDPQTLDAATVSAVGNPIVIKKDTIEYNASSFMTTENDVLEDLLKKLPGVEVGEDGSITVNGETIKKIMVDGKTFFLDDPQLASKNIPAKIVNKLKVIDKKSDQAEFTGIDDGEEEHIIDLSIKPGMMKGLFGTAMLGGGHDVPSEGNNMNDWRYQGAGFLARFTDSNQFSVVANLNNANNRGFNDLAGSLMQGMRGGGGGMGRGQGGWGSGNGITTSYMAGANGGANLLDNRMELTGNYLFNHSDKLVEEQSNKVTYMGDGNYLYGTKGHNDTHSNGHRFGFRLKHEFSENTSVIFEPQVNFGNGWYSQESTDTTFSDNLKGLKYKMNDAYTLNSGSNRNVNTSGFLLFRQRLGVPGRTLTVRAYYNLTNNILDGINRNGTTSYDADGSKTGETFVNQTFNSSSRRTSLSGTLTYTEPLGGNFYAEANYSYNWNRSGSEKETFDAETRLKDETYSNTIINDDKTQNIGANFLFQTDAVRAQLGFSAKPTLTHNETSKGGVTKTYDDFRWNFSPTAMLRWNISENSNLRINYRGNSSQPSTSQLMPVPDNTDPLNISFGNPSLTPYFTHSLSGDVRYNNRQTFTSFNVRFNGSYVQNPIVSTTWYDGGTAYSMPFNGPSSANAGFNAFVNLPFGQSGFTLTNHLNFSWSNRSSYVGTNVDMTTYKDKGFYDFMEEFVKRFNDKAYFDEHIALNTVNSFNFSERLRTSYRNDALEVALSGRTRMNRSLYSIASSKDNTTTWNNQVSAEINWNWTSAGLTVKTDFDYNWYNGYSTPQPSSYVWDAEIQKHLLKKMATISLKCYDILGMGRNITVTDASNYHTEAVNNTLGRYIMLSFTMRFGNFGNLKPPHGGPGGHGGPGRM